jgi:hypothetical protein
MALKSSLTREDFTAFMLHHEYQLFYLGLHSYRASEAMRGAVLVGFSSLQEMEAHVREKSLGDAMVTYAESANHLPYNPEHEIYVVIGIANADKTRLESCVYENTLWFECSGCHKVQIPEPAEQVDNM